VFLTQRDLPAPCFTTPLPFYAGAAAPLALAVAASLAGKLNRLSLLLAVGSLFVSCCALNYHACFTEDGILLRRSIDFTERRYAYAQVKKLRFVQDWRFVAWEFHRPHFMIELDDGTRWSSDDGFRRTDTHLEIETMMKVGYSANVMLQQVRSWD